MDKPVTEQELIEKSTGERVTLQAVESAIMSAHYFTARQGARAAALDTAVENGGMPDLSFIDDDLGLLTICVLRLWNGFTVLGQSACADPKNFNEEIGRRLARQDAVGKMWALMGYELKSRIARDQQLLAGALVEPQAGFETYIGTKVVNAYPCNRWQYNEMRGWILPANENGDDEGYLVEYTDRIENPPHVPGFKGYISWSPKEVFERAYRPVRVAAAQPQATSAEGSGMASQIRGYKGNVLWVDEINDKLWHEALKDGRKIDAIREYRHAYKATLKDAKEAVEKFMEENKSTLLWGTWIDRVRLEQSQLEEKLTKLQTYVMTDTFHELEHAMRQAMHNQVYHMEGYNNALKRRIAIHDAQVAERSTSAESDA